MKLKDRCRNSRSDRTLESCLYDLCLIFARDNQENFFRLHNRFDTHGVSLARYILFFFKETFVSFDGAFGQVYAVSLFFKNRTWLIKTDVTIVSQSEKLKIDTACFTDDFVISGAGMFAVRIRTVRYEGSGLVDIDVIEEICIHKITIALIVVPGKTSVFVQVHRSYSGKVQIPFVIPFDQLFVGADWCGTGGKTQYTVRLHNHLSCNYICRFAAHRSII